MLATASALLLAYLGAALFLDWTGRRAAPPGVYDAIVVLGCRVGPGGRPSASLDRRARRAAELFEAGLAPTIVLTGGVGDHPPSEARAAADVARSLGVPEDALVLEETSTSTEENAREARALVGPRRVLLVTDSYHVLRAERVFRRYFEGVVGVGSIAPTRARVRGALREVVAVSAYAALGRL